MYIYYTYHTKHRLHIVLPWGHKRFLGRHPWLLPSVDPGRRLKKWPRRTGACKTRRKPAGFSIRTIFRWNLGWLSHYGLNFRFSMYNTLDHIYYLFGSRRETKYIQCIHILMYIIHSFFGWSQNNKTKNTVQIFESDFRWKGHIWYPWNTRLEAFCLCLYLYAWTPHFSKIEQIWQALRSMTRFCSTVSSKFWRVVGSFKSR